MLLTEERGGNGIVIDRGSLQFSTIAVVMALCFEIVISTVKVASNNTELSRT